MGCVELYHFLWLPLLVWQTTTKDRVKDSEVCGTLPFPLSLITGLTTTKDRVKDSEVCGTLPFPLSLITGLPKNSEGQCETTRVCETLPFPSHFITGVRKQWWTVWVLRSIWNLGPFILSPVSNHLLNNVELCDIWNSVISSSCLYWSHEEQCGTVWALKSGWNLFHVCPTSITSAPVQNCSHEEWQGAVWMLKVVWNSGSFHFICHPSF